MNPYSVGRFRLTPNVEYAGKLIAVTQRCIENNREDVTLLRLEFEIYQRDEKRRELTALGAVASRDLVITSEAASDDGIRRYATALGVPRPDEPASWYGLQRRQKPPKWLIIRFGETDERDFRQPFAEIQNFDPYAEGAAFKILDEKIPADRALQYVSSTVAAKFLCFRGDPHRHPSSKTVNQFIDQKETEHGRRLVYRTPKGHRRINWRYLQQLWNMTPD